MGQYGACIGNVDKYCRIEDKNLIHLNFPVELWLHPGRPEHRAKKKREPVGI